ncbi:bystin-like [Hippocampus comes]|uniref:Bystin-like n=1 Tax=Hippocampus comes TaxID=109280 RepID=A0A3Q2YPW1_HIPCM|nr:PREDICTED: bystin-like [Hippocampus comes]
MPKVKKSKGGGDKRGQSDTLVDQMLQGDTVRSKGRVKLRDDRIEGEDNYVNERLSKKILQQARIQQEELQSEYGLVPKKKAPVTFLGPSSQDADSDEEWPTLGATVGKGDTNTVYDTEVVVDADDEKAIEMFMNKNPPMRQDPSSISALDVHNHTQINDLCVCVFFFFVLQANLSRYYNGEDNRKTDRSRNSHVRSIWLSDATT